MTVSHVDAIRRHMEDNHGAVEIGSPVVDVKSGSTSLMFESPLDEKYRVMASILRSGVAVAIFKLEEAFVLDDHAEKM